jgi:hypothetical protein
MLTVTDKLRGSEFSSIFASQCSVDCTPTKQMDEALLIFPHIMMSTLYFRNWPGGHLESLAIPAASSALSAVVLIFDLLFGFKNGPKEAKDPSSVLKITRLVGCFALFVLSTQEKASSHFSFSTLETSLSLTYVRCSHSHYPTSSDCIHCRSTFRSLRSSRFSPGHHFATGPHGIRASSSSQPSAYTSIAMSCHLAHFPIHPRILERASVSGSE